MKERTLSLLKNKYFLVFVIFLVWMAFFDPRSWQTIYEKKAKLKELQKKEAELTQKIAECRKDLHLLNKNAESIERFARENFYWQKANEEIFIVKTP
ncbi:MAG: FtsB family cell division protein [Ferruginibacter sp.]